MKSKAKPTTKAMKAVKAMKATKATKVMKKKTVSKIVRKAAKAPKGQLVSKLQDNMSPEDREWLLKRTVELKLMTQKTLKDHLSKLGLKAGIKRDMVNKLLAHETQARRESRARQARAAQVLEDKRRELEGLSSDELKQLCSENGLKLGMTKQERVGRLLAHFEEEGGVEQVLGEQDMMRRRGELSCMQTNDLYAMCSNAGIDPFVKEVLVERILRHELFAKGSGSLIPVLMNE